jgi:hypothetical protein
MKYWPLHSNGFSSLLRPFSYKQICYISHSLRLLVPSSQYAYRHFFFRGDVLVTPVIVLADCSFSLAGTETSSTFYGVQPSFLVGWFLCCCSPASPNTPSSGALVPSTDDPFRTCQPMWASGTGDRLPSSPVSSLGVGAAFPLLLDGQLWNPSLRGYLPPPGIFLDTPPRFSHTAPLLHCCRPPYLGTIKAVPKDTESTLPLRPFLA